MASSKLSRSNPSFNFPEDLIVDILSRLPVKSLIRFVVVCKAWYALIQNSYFISKHLKQSMVNPNLNLSYLLVISGNENTYDFSMASFFKNSVDNPVGLDFPFNGKVDAIVGVCNGLVCVSLSDVELNLVICNPATMKFHKISDCEFWDNSCRENGEAPLGFGFDPSSDDYKIIKTMRYMKEVKTNLYEYVEQAEIYTMSTNSWRVLEIDMPFYVSTRLSYASATIDGVFYWEGDNNPDSDALVWSFDMRDEVYRLIEGPKSYQGMWDDLTWETIQLKEELAMFVSTSIRCYNVWVLNKDGISWNEKFRIGPFPTIERPMQVGDTGGIIKVAGFGKEDDIIFLVRKEDDQGMWDYSRDNTIFDAAMFFSYNLRSREIKILPFAHKIYYFRLFWYTESLLPVKKND